MVAIDLKAALIAVNRNGEIGPGAVVNAITLECLLLPVAEFRRETWPGVGIAHAPRPWHILPNIG
jgi:hypothetical protein